MDTSTDVDRLQDPAYLKIKAEQEAADAEKELIARWKSHRHLASILLSAQHDLQRAQSYLDEAVDSIESIQIKHGGFAAEDFIDAQEACRFLVTLQQSVLNYSTSLGITSSDVPWDKRRVNTND
jgi:hypothetical protein